MKKILSIIIISLSLASCKNEPDKGKFKVTGELSNTADQKIYLEQLYFSQKNPEILDTAELKGGKFELSTIAAEEGLYRIRLEDPQTSLIFINDQPQISIKADPKNPSLQTIQYNSPANKKLKSFLEEISGRMSKAEEISARLQSLPAGQNNDSIVAAEKQKLEGIDESFRNYILNYIKRSPDPVLAMFAFGYTRNVDPAMLKPVLTDLASRYPDHQGIASFVLEYNRYLENQAKPQPTTSGNAAQGSMAPEITMNDINGKPYSLSQLKGKYVLVDFWASWCGPCRGENPNIVAAYNKYKNKNFTILGVSLDEDKDAWIKAIKDDGLSWQQVSDLKGWNSAAAPLYGFDAIPYNVLIDPTGKIIASALRGAALEEKLAEVLK